MKKILLFLFTVCFSAQFSLAQNPPKLVASYPLNSNGNDKSVNQFDANLVGNPKPAKDKNGNFGCAMQFDKNSHLEIPYNNKFNITSDSSFIISFWLKLDNLTGYDTILKRGNSGGMIYVQNDKILINNQKSGSYTIKDTNWHFVEYRFNGYQQGYKYGTCSLYVDQNDGPIEYSSTLPNFVNNEDIFLGNFKGKIDDLKFNTFRRPAWGVGINNTLESCKFAFNKKDDDLLLNPTLITSNNLYGFNLIDYTKGRDLNTNCNTFKADSNTVDLFVKFKATSTSATLDLNLNNASLESRLGLTSAPNTCQAIQKNKNLRTDIFTGLTIGNDYTVRIEIGGDAALGYARTSTANNASITLVGGSVTGVENNNQPTFSIAPNPSIGNFTFVSDENAYIIISDLLGSKVADLQNVIPNQNIDLQLPKGIYLLNVSNAKGSKIEKLVIE